MKNADGKKRLFLSKIKRISLFMNLLRNEQLLASLNTTSWNLATATRSIVRTWTGINESKVSDLKFIFKRYPKVISISTYNTNPIIQ